MERGNLAKNYILANFTKMFFLDLKGLKTSLILVTVEIACILTAETVELIFYKRSIFFVNSIGLSCRLIYCSNTRTYMRTRMSSLSRAYHSLTSLIEKKKNKLKIPLDVFNAGLFTNFAIPF